MNNNVSNKAKGILAKLLQSSRLPLFLIDFDGTLFAPDLRIITSPFLNRQSWRIIQKYQLPFILVTGRPEWTKKDELYLKIFGIPNPTFIFAGLGSKLYIYNGRNHFEEDITWKNLIQSSEMSFTEGENEAWNKEKIIAQLEKYINKPIYSICRQDNNPSMLRIKIQTTNLQNVLKKQKELQDQFFSGVRVFLSESRLGLNNSEKFTGYFLIVPDSCGKDHVVDYVVRSLSESPKAFEMYCFGDATVDLPMLGYSSNNPKVNVHSFLVSPTYLAQHKVESSPVYIKNTVVTNEDGPTSLLRILKIFDNTNSERISVAQNSPVRMLIKPLYELLDRLVDPKLTANQLSLRGLDYIIQSQKVVSAENSSLRDKMKVILLWTKGMSMDVFDGIRARKSSTPDSNGQLIDVFCDRGKEFVQLYFRAIKRGQKDKNAANHTFLTAISCILPSLARAEAEAQGVVVAELDKQGGSMLSRSKSLFKSFFFSVMGNDNASFKIDKEIFNKNRATFEARRGQLGSKNTTPDEKLVEKAEVRKNLLLNLLIEENEIIQKYLRAEMPENRSEYETFIEPILQIYETKQQSKNSVNQLADLDLSLKKIINSTF